MKYKIRAVADLHSALRDLEHQVRDPRHLRVGRDYASFQMRPREFLGNWLMCVVLCHATGRRWTLSADPLGGDGAILDRDENTGFLTEHVFVPPPRGSAELDVEDQLLDAVRAKAAKGAEYARGKTLVVFSEAHGVWKPTRVGEAIADLHGFDAVWAIALEGVENGAYAYWVTRLEARLAPVWRVRISPEFTDWGVEAIQ